MPPSPPESVELKFNVESASATVSSSIKKKVDIPPTDSQTLITKSDPDDTVQFAHIAGTVAIAKEMAGDFLATLPNGLIFIGGLISTMPLSYIGERYGLRASYVVGTGAGLTGATLCLLAMKYWSFPLLCLGLLFQGTQQATTQLLRFGVRSVCPPKYVSRALSWVVAGAAIAAPIGPQITQAAVWIVPSTKYLGIYIVMECLIFAMTLTVMCLRIPSTSTAKSLTTSDSETEPEAVVESRSAIVVRFFSSKRYLIAVVSGLVSYMVMVLMMAPAPIAITNSGFTFSDQANVIMAHVLGMFAPSLITGYLIERFGSVRMNIILELQISLTTLNCCKLEGRRAMGALLLPPPSSADTESGVFNAISRGRSIPYEPVGLAFLSQLRRSQKTAGATDDSLLKLLRGEDADADDEIDDVPESKALLALDPLEWKSQDHYAVLGLEKLRWKATEDEIRKAYRRKALKHHPDKKKDRSDDSFFKCIQKAWEVMSDPVKRRQWDSVDRKFDDSIPSLSKKGDFYKIYGKAFDNNARFSKVQPVPHLGDSTTSREDVESFYDFWFNFDSWRSFEAFDEEDPDKAESREEKRWIERQNKVVRLKMKKDDNARLSKLVEQAMKLDPRLAAFKEQDRLAKEAKRKEKEDAQRKIIEDAKAAEEAIRKAKEKLEEEEKARTADAKKDKDARKKVLRRERKAVRDLLLAENYFLPSENPTLDALATESVRLDEVFEFHGDNLTGISAYREELTKSVDIGRTSAREVVETQYIKIHANKDAARQKLEASRLEAARVAKEKQEKGKEIQWSPKEVAALIVAVRVYPGGTISRWDKIAAHVNTHGAEDNEDDKAKKRRFKRPEDCIKRSNELKNAEVPQQAEKDQLQAVASSSKHNPNDIEIKDPPTLRYTTATDSITKPNGLPTSPKAENQDSPENGTQKTTAPAKGTKTAAPTTAASQKPPIPAPQPNDPPLEHTRSALPQETSTSAPVAPNGLSVNPAESSVWSIADQQALESALRLHPAANFTANPSERWKTVALAVPGKSVKEVKSRVKLATPSKENVLADSDAERTPRPMTAHGLLTPTSLARKRKLESDVSIPTVTSRPLAVLNTNRPIKPSKFRDVLKAPSIAPPPAPIAPVATQSLLAYREKTPEELMEIGHSSIPPRPPPINLLQHADQVFEALSILVYNQFLVEWGEGNVALVVANAAETKIRSDRFQKFANSPEGVRKTIAVSGDESPPADSLALANKLAMMNHQYEDIEGKLGKDNMQWKDHLDRIQRDSIVKGGWSRHYSERLVIYKECVENFILSLIVLQSKGTRSVLRAPASHPTRCLIPQWALRGPNRLVGYTPPPPKRPRNPNSVAISQDTEGRTEMTFRGNSWICENAALACGHDGNGRLPNIVRAFGQSAAKLTGDNKIVVDVFEVGKRTRQLELSLTSDVEVYVGKLYFERSKTSNVVLIVYEDPTVADPDEEPKMFMFQARSVDLAKQLASEMVTRGAKRHQGPYVDESAQ
ncbi:hypothetical protein HDU93_002083 [Gonapodya sp. JEL0774]|nr:hypothetical protein HDU93_002083 [Gonapodya sp. JEL0774]